MIQADLQVQHRLREQTEEPTVLSHNRNHTRPAERHLFSLSKKVSQECGQDKKDMLYFSSFTVICLTHTITYSIWLNFQGNFEIPFMPDQKAVSNSPLHMTLPSVVMQQPQITILREKQHHQNGRAGTDKHYSRTQHDLMLHLSYFKNKAT